MEILYFISEFNLWYEIKDNGNGTTNDVSWPRITRKLVIQVKKDHIEPSMNAWLQFPSEPIKDERERANSVKHFMSFHAIHVHPKLS